MPVNSCLRAGNSALVVCATLLCLQYHPSLAQQPGRLADPFGRKIHVELTAAPMDSVFEALAKDTHVNIVADGEPLRRKADFKFDGSLRDALDKVGNTFDYTWTVSKGGVVLMTKQFTDPKERPQVNLPEMLEMTRNIIHALCSVDYDKDPANWMALVREMAQSFTPQQLGALELGKKLRGSDLLPQQQAEVQQASVANTFVSAFHLWDDLLPNLEGMPTSRLQARKLDEVRPDSKTHPYDYLYIYRRSNGQLHVSELTHIKAGFNAEILETP